MAEPQVYDSQREISRNAPIQPIAVKAEFEKDDLSMFVTRYDDQQTVATLRSWMTFGKETRLANCKKIIETSFADEKKTSRELKRRYLLFIIVRESRSVDGCQQVAELALSGLWPARKAK